MKKLFPAIQKLGKSLMLPIAVLPVAGLLLRLGQPDLLDLPYVAAAGNAVFANLGLLFAIGVAVGLARGSNGAAGLAAVVAYLVTTEGAKILIDVPPEVIADAAERAAQLLSADYKSAAIMKMSVPAGLISGIVAGNLYNRYSEIRLPDYLAFFSGRRFVPIVSGFAALLIAALFGFGWPVLETGMNALSEAVIGAGEIGLFGYGLLNRILIVTGLHHILNNLAWFIVGDFEGVTGDLRRYFAGDPAAGAFMSGFFPVMMFGLPAACLAMYRSVKPERRKAVGGLLVSMALTSFLTGITEPIEFTFMFVAPVLFVIHAVLTGVSMAVMDLLQIRLGFGFSAGLFDYVLNFNKATRPLMMLPIGAIYFTVYYAIFRFFIVRFDIKTPGRDDVEPAQAGAVTGAPDEEAAKYLVALGGPQNLLAIDACMTRLRLNIASRDAVDEASLRALGAAGMIYPTSDTMQVIVGLRADAIAAELGRVAETPAPQTITRATESDHIGEHSLAEDDFHMLLQALGGLDNVISVDTRGTRLKIRVKDARLVDDARVAGTGLRGAAVIDEALVHVLADGSPAPIAQALRLLIDAAQADPV
ncbi:MAG: PTS transporter subunit EIIC [Gammaproteobacteria bacterium]|jgi:PTS system N-acetylglucosamine-specific IIC component|nr:PTS transporter subunit EIIC [Gammaproteobacteria bacterium]